MFSEPFLLTPVKTPFLFIVTDNLIIPQTDQGARSFDGSFWDGVPKVRRPLRSDEKVCWVVEGDP